MAAANAVGRHLVVVGFMGAGKTTVARDVAAKLGRFVYDTDSEIEESEEPIPVIFERHGEEFFRDLESSHLHTLLNIRDELVISLGGGAVETPEVREALTGAFVVWLDVGVETCWQRARASDRPLAQDEAGFRERFARRRELYSQVADAVVTSGDPDDVVLAAAGVHVERGALQRLGELVPGEQRAALVADARVAGIYGAVAQMALGARLASTHELPVGEEAKSIAAVERLWKELTLTRRETLVALGGGCTIDAAGFAAATYLRGIAWVAVPSTLVGQVDAAIGGKTAIDLPAGKNLVGAFHMPARVVIDPALLETLPPKERQEGMAEVVKTGLLADEPLWELEDDELVRRTAAFKATIVLRDPREAGERAILNLGHTFAHALEAAAAYEGVTHGQAVALGLLAALRLSGRDTDVVEEILDPQPVRVDRERAWAALQRDKKAGLVLLGDNGPEWDVRLAADDVRRALDSLIAG